MREDIQDVLDNFNALQRMQHDTFVRLLNLAQLAAGETSSREVRAERTASRSVVADLHRAPVLPNLDLGSLDEIVRMAADNGEPDLDEGHLQVFRQAPYRLTEREIEVLKMTMEGNSSKEISRALGSSPRTVDQQRAKVRQKLGARNIAHLGVSAWSILVRSRRT